MKDFSHFFHHIDIKSIQRFLNLSVGALLHVDGVAGPKTWEVVKRVLDALDLPSDYWQNWSLQRIAIAVEQALLKRGQLYPGVIDGFYGPNTAYAVERWQDALRNVGMITTPIDSPWPAEKAVEQFYGPPGTNHAKLTSPYPLRLAWDTSTRIRSFTINEKCRDSAELVLNKVLAHYGIDRVRALGLDLYAGCFNDRPKRGGVSKSMHAYACAIDFDSANNQLRWGRDKARFAKPEYDAWWSFWEAEGWVSLGRERNYDWMHVQAAQL